MSKPITIRLAEGVLQKLQEAAANMGVSINDLVEEAVTARLDDYVVTLVTRSTEQAGRLRRLVRTHRSLGVPFPNNDPDLVGFKVCKQASDGQWKPIDGLDVHSVPSVGADLKVDADLKSVFGARSDCGYPLGHFAGRRGLCPRCGG